MKSWDQIPADWNHPDTVEYRKAYGPPVYEELYFRLRANGDLASLSASGEDPRGKIPATLPEPPLDTRKPDP